MKHINEHHIRKRVKSLMKARKIKNSALGEILGASKVNQWQKGKRFISGKKKEISIDDINRIARVFDVDVEFLLALKPQRQLNMSIDKVKIEGKSINVDVSKELSDIDFLKLSPKTRKEFLDFKRLQREN